MNTGLNRFFFRETVQDSGIGDEKVIRQRAGGEVCLLTFPFIGLFRVAR
jgi:hypothetical protein